MAGRFCAIAGWCGGRWTYSKAKFLQSMQIPVNKKPIGQKLREKADCSDPNACWIWKGQKSTGGYGQIEIGYVKVAPNIWKPIRRRAHRISYEFHRGPIPEGMMVCHHCDTPLCINPHHLFLGTARDNFEDMMAKGRNRYDSSRSSHPGERNPNAKLTEALVRQIRETRQKEGLSYSKLGARFGIEKKHAHEIATRQLWAHVQ